MAQSGAPKPQSSAYFEKKGEVNELRQLLRSAAADRDLQKKRDAIKKVIAYMTLGIDVSPLFSEMVMASATQDMVQKKMVYLYLTNYSESNSELAILAVNTFLKDCRDEDPMIRGLALRSLCSINLVNMVEYLQPAVQRALQDVNGYVRKTAVIGVVKLFHISRSAVLDCEIVDRLKGLVHDNDAHVVANTICAVEEVLADEGGLQPSREIITNLLNRLNQFSEWGQCAVLRILAKYQVADESEMFDIMNILDSLLKQSSSAVVLGVTKIFLDLTSNRSDLQVEVLRRLKGPLLTLMASATFELAYTVLVHIQSICMRGAPNVDVFGPEFKQFFCRCSDPSYLKNVKIDILTMLADAGSAEHIVGELSEYVTDVDAEISRRAIRAIGKIAIRVPSTAEMIVGSLTALLELDIDYVSTEAAVVMKDLVRKYPMQFQRASGAVERCIRIVTEPEGKCALLWILGEYGLLVEDAPYLLEPMIDGFLEENSGSVRLEMLTAAMKLFFCRPPEMQKMLGRLLQKAIQETTHPDVRDRALLYYRLLEQGPEEARSVICAPKEIVEEFQEEMDAEVRDRIFEEFNTLSTVYQQPSSKFVHSKTPGAGATYRMQPPPNTDVQASDAEPPSFGQTNGFEEAHTPSPALVDSGPPPVPAADVADLLGGMDGPPPAAAAPAPRRPAVQDDLLGMDDLLGGDVVAAAPVAATPAFGLVHAAVMDPNLFQTRWQQLPQAAAVQRQCSQRVPSSTTEVEDALRAVGIAVIASGQGTDGPADLKFYFYGKQASGPAGAAPGDVWFLVELKMAPHSATQCVLKADNAQAASVEQFLALMWSQLAPWTVA